MSYINDVFFIVPLLLLGGCEGFLSAKPLFHCHSIFSLQSEPLNNNNASQRPFATILGYLSDDEEFELKEILIKTGYDYVSSSKEDIGSIDNVFAYKYVKASGMLKLMEGTSSSLNGAPKWIPVQSGEEVRIINCK